MLDEDELRDCLYQLRLAKVFYDTGVLWEEFQSFYLDPENASQIPYQIVMDLFGFTYEEDSDCVTFTVGCKELTEYCALCRDYSRKKRLRLSDNPYLTEIHTLVSQMFCQPGCYYCSYEFRDHPTQKRGTAIYFTADTSYFYEYDVLLELYAELVQFLRERLPALRAELERSGKLMRLPIPTERRAA